MHISCVMFTGFSVSSAARETIFKCAKAMSQEGQNKGKLFHDDCRGFVHTNYERASIGTLSGILFEAEFITTKGETKATFLIKEEDLDSDQEGDVEWHEVKSHNTKKNRYTPSLN